MNKLKEVMDAKKPKVKSKELAEKAEVSLKMIQLVRQQKSGIEVEKALRITKVLKVNIKKIFDGNGFEKGKKK